VYPLHRRVLVGDRALRDEVVDVRRPVLDRRVPAARAGLDDDLDDRRVERVAGVDRCRAALDVVHEGALVDDDQRTLELAHVFRVDAEVGPERHLDLDPRRHVDERAARPDGGVQSRELVVVLRDDRPAVLLDELLLLAQAGIHVQEEHALVLEILLELVVDDLAFVLRADAGQVLLLGLRDSELVPGVLDVRRQVLPRLGLLFGRPDVVEDVVEVDARDVSAPAREGTRQEVLERLEPELAHPVGLVLVLGDRSDELRREAPAGLEEVVLGSIGCVEAVLVVAADLGDDLGLGLGLCHHKAPPNFAYLHCINRGNTIDRRRRGYDANVTSVRVEQPAVPRTQVHRALSEPSRLRILEVLRDAEGPLDVRELGRRVGLHANTVRLHLAVLAEAGLVSASREQRAGPGRPPVLYQATTDALQAGPLGRYRLLAEILASYLASAPDPSAGAEQAGRAWGAHLIGRPPPFTSISNQDTADQVVHLHDRLGFRPELKRAKNGKELV